MKTTKKLTSKQERAHGGVPKNGWTPPVLRGGTCSVSVGTGMEALSTANAGEALSSWLSRYHMDGSPLQKVRSCTREWLHGC